MNAEPESNTGPRGRWLAWSMWILTACLASFSIHFVFLNDFASFPDSFCCSGFPSILTQIMALACSTVGVLIVSHRPGNSIGWIFVFSGFGMSLNFFALNYAVYTGVTQPGSLPFGSVMAWLASWIWVPSWWLIMTFLLLLFPDGKLPSKRWRLVAHFVVIILAANLAVRMFKPGPLTWGMPTFDNPFGIGGAFGEALRWADGKVFQLLLISVFASAVSLIVRFIGATGIERQQIKWLAYAGGMTGLALAVSSGFLYGSEIVWNPWVETILFLPFLGIPISVGIAILKHRLFDIDLLINRTLVYFTLTAITAGLYVLVVGSLSNLLQNQNDLTAPAIALLIVVALVQPLRRGLQNNVNRLLRFDPSRRNESQVTLQKSSERPDEAREENVQIHIITEPDSSPSTRLVGRWLWIARLAWVAVFLTLTVMYALGFLAVHEELSTVCEEELCTLRQQIRHTDTGKQVVGWPGPPIGYADRLRPDQIESLRRLSLSPDQYGWLGALQMGIPALVYLLIAAGLFWQKSDNWMVLFVSVMVATFPLQDMPLPFTLAVRQPAWEWAFDLASIVALSSFLIFPLIFPTGRFVPRWTRWMVLFVLSGAVIAMLFRNSILNIPGADILVVVYLLISLGTGVYAQLYRYFRVASPLERQQLKWVIVGLAGFIGTALAVLQPLDALLASPVVSADPERALMLSVIPDTLFRGISLFIPVSITISVLRYRLWDIDIIINRTLVYGALTGMIVGAFVVIVGLISTIFQSSGNSIIAIIATGLIALLFNPLRQRLQRWVNHLMYGERDDPYAVLSRLGRRLESSLAPEAVLPTVVTTVRDVLRLPYVAIYLQHDLHGYKIVAESASPLFRIENGKIRVPGMEREGRCIPLIHQGETVGYIVLGPRAPNEAFSSTDLRLLEDLAPQVGVAVHAVRLTADLQRSREQLVLAREEERRRLRRDLHDGLGPQLAGLALKLETLRNRLRDDPLADSLLADLAKRTQDATADIRRLVYELRPPTLDELGLVSALREGASQYRQQGLNGVHITIDAPDNLPPLPAAVEVAVYRIAQEALLNVMRHADARTCQVRLRLDESAGLLCLEIQDDGKGLPMKRRAGVGLNSMRERAEELGGAFTITPVLSGGTLLTARLPCNLNRVFNPKDLNIADVNEV